MDHRETEIVEHLENLVLQVLIEIAVVNPCNRNLAYARNVNLPRTIHNHAQVRIDLTPDADLQLVIRPHYVIARNLHAVRGSKCAGRLSKKRLAEKRKRAPNRVRHNLLELSLRMQWQFDFLELRRIHRGHCLFLGGLRTPGGQLRRLNQRRR